MKNWETILALVYGARKTSYAHSEEYNWGNKQETKGRDNNTSNERKYFQTIPLTMS